MARVFDCFTFFNEIDLLELRFEELHNNVDYFVVCEANMTFKGTPKELIFEQTKDRFQKFSDKIIHLVVDLPAQATAWEREHFQRDSLRKALTSVNDDDVIIISDADEILRPQAVEFACQAQQCCVFDMPMYQFYMNMEAKSDGWSKVFSVPGGMLGSIENLSTVRSDPSAYFKAQALPFTICEMSGWHFTFLGGANRVREKLNAYSHAGDVVDSMLEESGAENQILVGRQVGNLKPLKLVPIDGSFPKSVSINRKKYEDSGFLKDVYERVSELEDLRSSELQKVAGEIESRMVQLRKDHAFAQQRRAETGKRLEWMTRQFEEADRLINDIRAVLAQKNLSEAERIVQISNRLSSQT